MTINKKSLSERDICSQFITPAIQQAGWDMATQVREEVSFTAGQILVHGKTVRRGTPKRADYILYYRPNLPIAVIEAKENNKPVGAGMQQALAYADVDALDIPFVFSSNGDAFQFHDKTRTDDSVEQEIPLDQFPSPQDLWSRYCKWKGIDQPAEQLVTQDFYDDGSKKSPRYYQQNAINRTVEAIARGQDRALLVMATGTGKTYTAFQIIWRLWKAGAKKRILFLADRNILIDQTRVNDFKPFGGAMTKISKRTADKSFEIYLALYQAITGVEESKKVFKDFSPDFFDLIVIDECHRGSASEDSQWREILDYFSTASQIGLTATPKETKYVSNINYFGEPIYTYSLKQGIQDGFLAPYRVVRIDFDKDLSGWRPEAGKKDRYGNELEDRIYNQKDFDRSLVLDKRTQAVARKVTEFLKGTNRYDKTIVFCEDIDHAERMRLAFVNENADLVAANRKYVMRITGDNPEGKAELDTFIDPEGDHPVIVTTSRLLTTGVDAKTCKLIVLDRRIGSMTEFKQIIGRGTRVDEDYGKYFFTIMDFKKATENFADPDFDGPPICIYEPQEGEDVVPPDEIMDNDEKDETTSDDSTVVDDDYTGGEEIDPVDPPIIDITGIKPKKYYVNDIPVTIVAERVQYFDPTTGKLITESLKDYTRTRVSQDYESLDAFLQDWNAADKKQVILDEMEEHGVFFEALADEVGQDFDPFDLICHVAFDQPPLTRQERAEGVRKRDYFTRYGEEARGVLQALLEKYADEGPAPLEDMTILKISPFSQYGTPTEIIKLFGSREKYLKAIHDMQALLYETA
ncbi:DEAD/DEAH box helicase family protein [Rubinisphaera sp.]|uniref:EcoAI/FtnUII family type I restriction enzme subunit R n=1 Tax=Rubinisphaera sp. TaxID=2024857 RepID=UPI0025DD79E0|nr:DEAD/DEAH box helicase family protein [Rubinisphaera sp.]